LFYQDGPRQQLTKVSWFFSSEKNTFLILPYMSQRHGGLVSTRRRSCAVNQGSG